MGVLVRTFSKARARLSSPNSQTYHIGANSLPYLGSATARRPNFFGTADATGAVCFWTDGRPPRAQEPGFDRACWFSALDLP
jgi:hypothetical protein